MHPLKVSLEELYNGTTKKLSLSKNVVCAKCEGCAAPPPTAPAAPLLTPTPARAASRAPRAAATAARARG